MSLVSSISNFISPIQIGPTVNQAAKGIGKIALTILQGAITISCFTNLNRVLNSHINPFLDRTFGKANINTFRKSCDAAAENTIVGSQQWLFSEGSGDTINTREAIKRKKAGFKVGYYGVTKSGGEVLINTIGNLGSAIWSFFDPKKKTDCAQSRGDTQLLAQATVLGLEDSSQLFARTIVWPRTPEEVAKSAIAKGILLGRLIKNCHPLLYKNVQKIALFSISALAASILVHSTPLMVKESFVGASALCLAYGIWKLETASKPAAQNKD